MRRCALRCSRAGARSGPRVVAVAFPRDARARLLTFMVMKGAAVMDKIMSLVTDERTARIALACMTEPADAVTGRLVRRVGAVETVGLLDSDGGVAGLSEVEAGLWRRRLGERADASILRAALKATGTDGLATVMPGDDAWPAGFDALGDRAPLVLWARGDAGLLTASLPSLVSITGARAATSYWEHVAGMLAGDLAAKGRIVVSGAAYGIDGTAHRAALAAGRPTIAFLAGGADRPYPMGHQDLLDRIAHNGVVASETPPGATPTRWRFLQRARLLAAVPGATVIVKAG